MIKKIKKIIKNPRHIVIALNRRNMLRIIPDKPFLKLYYKSIYGVKLNLKKPRTFNEKMQWLKIYDRKPEYTLMVDKYEMKKIVSQKIGENHVIPTLGIWDRFEDIDFSKLPNKFVLKCTHDSGGLVVCRDKNKLDIEKTKIKIKNSLKRNYYWTAREWPYKKVKPRIMAEEYIDCVSEDINLSPNEISTDELQKKVGLLDYKFLCCNGVVKGMFLDIGIIGSGTGHADEYYRNVYNSNFELLDFLESRENYPIKIKKPILFEKMKKIAEKLSEGMKFLRVDLYEINGKIFVGEFTFYHGSGLSNYFKPIDGDYILGNWIDLGVEHEK